MAEHRLSFSGRSRVLNDKIAEAVAPYLGRKANLVGQFVADGRLISGSLTSQDASSICQDNLTVAAVACR